MEQQAPQPTLFQNTPTPGTRAFSKIPAALTEPCEFRALQTAMGAAQILGPMQPLFRPEGTPAHSPFQRLLSFEQFTSGMYNEAGAKRAELWLRNLDDALTITMAQEGILSGVLIADQLSCILFGTCAPGEGRPAYWTEQRMSAVVDRRRELLAKDAQRIAWWQTARRHADQHRLMLTLHSDALWIGQNVSSQVKSDPRLPKERYKSYLPTQTADGRLELKLRYNADSFAKGCWEKTGYGSPVCPTIDGADERELSKKISAHIAKNKEDLYSSTVLGKMVRDANGECRVEQFSQFPTDVLICLHEENPALLANALVPYVRERLRHYHDRKYPSEKGTASLEKLAHLYAQAVSQATVERPGPLLDIFLPRGQVAYPTPGPWGWGITAKLVWKDWGLPEEPSGWMLALSLRHLVPGVIMLPIPQPWQIASQAGTLGPVRPILEAMQEDIRIRIKILDSEKRALRYSLQGKPEHAASLRMGIFGSPFLSCLNWGGTAYNCKKFELEVEGHSGSDEQGAAATSEATLKPDR